MREHAVVLDSDKSSACAFHVKQYRTPAGLADAGGAGRKEPSICPLVAPPAGAKIDVPAQLERGHAFPLTLTTQLAGDRRGSPLRERNSDSYESPYHRPNNRNQGSGEAHKGTVFPSSHLRGAVP